MVKSGFYFTEMMPRSGNPEPGTAEPENWTPYKVWCGDKWQCEGCGAEIVSGTGRSPIAEHYQPAFADMTARLNADQLKVNDC